MNCRHTLLKALLALSAAAVLASAQAATDQEYPSRTVTLVVPYAPGGTADLVARVIGQALGQSLGQSFIVDNRPGAGGTIAMGIVSKAVPDGYTLFVNDVAQTVAPALFTTLKFDPIKDFVPIALIAETPVVLAVTNDLPVQNLAQLLKLGKEQPDRLNFGSGGLGSGPHIAGELLKKVSGVPMTHVPHKGAGPAMTELIGGQIQLLSAAAPSIVPHIKDGRVRALAVAGKRRLEAIPDVPASAEAGTPEFVFSLWFGLAAPKGTPADVVQKLAAHVQRALADPQVAARLAQVGAFPGQEVQQAFAERIASESVRFSALVAPGGVKRD